MPRSSASLSAPASPWSRTSIYRVIVAGAALGTWLLRGFGTALMHGCTTAVFAMMGLALARTGPESTPRIWLLPGFALAFALHSAFNHMFLSPKMSTLAVLVVLPPLMLRSVPQERGGGRRMAGPRLRPRCRDD